MSGEGIPGKPKVRTLSVLTWIAIATGPVSIHDLVREFRISKNDAAQRLKKLRRAGAITPVEPGHEVARECAGRAEAERRKRAGKSRCGCSPAFYMLTDAGRLKVAAGQPPSAEARKE